MVVGADGQEYGPANVDTLRQWASENRLGPQTSLKNFQTGQVVVASSVPGIFPPAPSVPPQVAPSMNAGPMNAGPMNAGPGAPQGPGGQNWAQPPNYYQRGPVQANSKPFYGQDTGATDVMWAILRSVLAIVFFYFLHGIGLIFAIYGVIYAFRGVSKGHKLAWLAVGISIAALIAVIVGWVLRMGGSSGY
jgi:hypothetical protein